MTSRISAASLLFSVHPNIIAGDTDAAARKRTAQRLAREASTKQAKKAAR